MYFQGKTKSEFETIKEKPLFLGLGYDALH